ncbi:2-hydroxychromene-2-carboxylate isomerase [Stigmatella aurantiaca]|uniref:2-hydroxychromene-2-carboxylate isomerase n=1 Tax=Stigmatella aurantiaca (strain DW4/3-1) TaxID=378806 RepID=Q09B82_STIAD|nr:2-hydroxychromene-2-carboxylate isomerase [Stigmatella aurantiaca]ADO69160.1 2-hydroxychromene-2-carboxylate isomerase family protein [Stigmatella aurantiaca DW4/3-1]EAU68955.1 2-hydroxychromene-2-carboxylate isomerase family protein [Stigmatella aurantiaca DW4/3-1]
MQGEIEFWFDFASTYSYVAAMRIEEASARVGARVLWRPFLLGPIFEAQQGIKDSPFNVNPARGLYMWRDLERLCAKYRLPWRRPSVFPQNSTLASRIAAVATEESWGPDYVRAVFRANFAEARDIAARRVVESLLAQVGADPQAVFARAELSENKPRLRELTTQAVRLGIFGAPNFIVNGELFFGQDRLEDALALLSE